MNKFSIIGALCFIAAVVVGYFCNFDAAIAIEIALAAFGLCSVIVSAIKAGKEKSVKTWKTIVVIVLACIGGALCAIGGLENTIFSTISGAVLALIAVIVGAVTASTSSTETTDSTSES